MRCFPIAHALAIITALPAVGFGDLFDDFDPANPNVTATQNGGAPGPMVLGGGPTGDFLRLINDGAGGQANYYAYDRTAVGAFSRVRGQFDFSGFSGDQPADGFSYLLLPTADFGISGAGPITYAGENPNVANTFGVGFDTHPGTTNTVSLHFNNAEIITNNVAQSDVHFSNGTFNRAVVDVKAAAGGSAVTVQLTGDLGGSPTTVTPFTNLFIGGMTPYENRVQFGGRTGGANQDVNIDNLSVLYSNPTAAPSTIGTQASFDGGGTPYITTVDGAPDTQAPSILPGGPTGNFLRLTHDGINNQSNSIAFDSTYAPGNAAAVSTLQGSFDFRGASATGAPADGFSLALIPTATFGDSGPGPGYTAEEPNIADAFALGFDFHPTASQNSISVHWDGVQIAENNSLPFDLDNGTFHGVDFEIHEVQGGALVDVFVTEDIHGTPGAPITVFDDLFVSDLELFDFRTFFRGRTGGLNMSIDLDNISVELVPEPGTIAIWSLLGLAAIAWVVRKRPMRS